MRALWANNFEWLMQADPPAVELDIRGVTIPIADPPGPWSTGGKWTQRRAAPAHAPIPDLSFTIDGFG